MKFTATLICLLALALLASEGAVAQQRRTTTTRPYTTRRAYVPPPPSDFDSHWAVNHSPWDFSGLFGLYNPGWGLQGLAAYRVMDSVLPNLDDSLSVESGLGYISVSDTYQGVSVSYSQVEIPFMARWDFRLQDTGFIFGPRAGFNYLTGGTINVNGVNVTMRGGALYLQVGGFAMYKFNEKWAVRAGLMFINYTAVTAGATFFL